jgi:hypothetical protein
VHVNDNNFRSEAYGSCVGNNCLPQLMSVSSNSATGELSSYSILSYVITIFSERSVVFSGYFGFHINKTNSHDIRHNKNISKNMLNSIYNIVFVLTL